MAGRQGGRAASPRHAAEQETESSRPLLQAQSRKSKPEVGSDYKPLNLTPPPRDFLLLSRPYNSDLLATGDTKYSNTRVYGGHFSFKLLH